MRRRRRPWKLSLGAAALFVYEPGATGLADGLSLSRARFEPASAGPARCAGSAALRRWHLEHPARPWRAGLKTVRAALSRPRDTMGPLCVLIPRLFVQHPPPAADGGIMSVTSMAPCGELVRAVMTSRLSPTLHTHRWPSDACTASRRYRIRAEQLVQVGSVRLARCWDDDVVQLRPWLWCMLPILPRRHSPSLRPISAMASRGRAWPARPTGRSSPTILHVPRASALTARRLRTGGDCERREPRRPGHVYAARGCAATAPFVFLLAPSPSRCTPR